MRAFLENTEDLPSEQLRLGIDGFCLEDLYEPPGLRRLNERFFSDLRQADPALGEAFDAYRSSGGKSLPAPAESELLIQVATHVSAFIAKLFGIQAGLAELSRRLLGEVPLFDFKREFISRRVFKKGAPDRPTVDELPELTARMRLLLRLGFGRNEEDDAERALAESILTLLDIERLFAGQLPKTPAPEARSESLGIRWQSLRRALLSTPEGTQAFGSALASSGSDPDELEAVRRLLALADRWTYARALHPIEKKVVQNW